MPFHVRDPETDTLLRELARRRGVGLTEIIKQMVTAELKREPPASDYLAKVREIQERIAQRGKTGLVADKAFFDELSGQGGD